MYDPVFSNHVGIVINNQDPENRGRLQIFVPHVSNTLFADWNQGLTDKIFKSSEVNNSAFGGGVLERLKEQLPWSEIAVPAFGGGTAGPIKFTGNASAMPSYTANPLAVTPALMLINAKSQNLNNQPAISVTAYHGTDIGANGQTGNVQNDGRYPTVDLRTDYSNLDYITLDDMHKINLQTAQQYLANVPSPSDGESYALGPAGSQPTADQWANFLDSLALHESVTYGQYIAINNQYAENFSNDGKTYAISEGLFSNSIGDLGVTAANIYDPAAQSAATARKIVDKLSNSENAIFGSPVYNSNGKLIKHKGVASEYGTVNRFAGLSPNVISDKLAGVKRPQTTPSPTPTGTAQPIKIQDTLAAEAGVPMPSSVGGAAGFFSRPAVGAKVWVFFYDGDVQRPVYFASVQEATNYQVGNQNLTRV